MAAASTSRQMGILLWKNWMFKRRKWKELVAMIVIPLAFMALLLVMRRFIKTHVQDSPSVGQLISVDHLPDPVTARPPDGPVGNSGRRWRIVYSPTREDTSSVMRRVAERLGVDAQGFDEESDLERMAQDESGNSSNIICGVVFTSALSRNTGSIGYTLRFPPIFWNTGKTMPVLNRKGGSPIAFRLESVYDREGFLAVQHAVHMSIMAELSPESSVDDITVHLARFPMPPKEFDVFSELIGELLPLFILLCYCIIVQNLIRDVVLEKEKMLKEYMRLMGLGEQLHWISWLIEYFLISLILSLIFVLVIGLPLVGRPVVCCSDLSLLAVFLILFSLANVMFCFLISSMFSKASRASTVGMLLYMLFYVVYTWIQRKDDLSLSTKTTSCLLHVVATSFGARMAADASNLGIGLRWSTLTMEIGGDLTFGAVILMLLVDCILYGLLAVYLDAVIPGEFGSAKPWYFPFKPSYWPCVKGSRPLTEEEQIGESTQLEKFEPCPADVPAGIKMRGLRKEYESKSGSNLEFGSAKPWYFPFKPSYWPCVKGSRPLTEEEQIGESTQLEKFEPCPADVPAGIKMRGLRKEYESKSGSNLAVVNTNLDIKENEITVLLGQNGAGKSTTISMLTGVLPPTKGSVYINDVDIKTDLAQARSFLGVCPQHDTSLFDILTVEEHLRFYSKLKGASDADSETQVSEMIEALDFSNYRNHQALTLSGGWKRRLSCAIALIGDPKVVILDEPTTGMDPEARGVLWRYLTSRKSGRTTLVTTHALDEAAVVGDRVAIMAAGSVKCYGSTLFLREKYGCGYELTVEMDFECKADDIQHVIKSHIEEASLNSDIGSQLVFALPPESTSVFEALFQEFEDKKDSLKVASYGVRASTLDDVFVRIGSTELGEATADSDDEKLEEQEDDQHLLPTEDTAVLTPRPGPFMVQLQAMLLKRALVAWRSNLVLLQFLLPLFFITVVCFHGDVSAMITKPDPKVVLSPDLYSRVYSYLSTNDSNDALVSQLGSAYKDALRNMDVQEIAKTGAKGPDSNYTDLELFLIEKRSAYPQAGNRYALFATDIQRRQEDDNSGHVINAYFNNIIYHTEAVLLSVIDNMLLQVRSGADYSIEVSNHPFPPSKFDQAQQQNSASHAIAFAIALYTLLGLCFFFGYIAYLTVQERQVKAKQLQLSSGLSTAVFWLGNAIWDMLLYCILLVAIVIIWVIFKQDPFIKDGMGATIVLFLMFGIVMIPLVYILSKLFSVPASAYNWSVVLLFFTVVIGAILTLIFPKSRKVLLGLLPNLSFTEGLCEIYNNFHRQDACQDLKSLEATCIFIQSQNESHHCCQELGEIRAGYFAWERPGVGQPLIFLLVFTPIIIYTLVMMESTRWHYHEIRKSLKARGGSGENEENVQLNELGYSRANEDADVTAESQFIWSHAAEDLCREASVLVVGLTKHYGSHCAVDKLTFKVSPGECFGLLGANGAGKTTVFEILTGNRVMSSGQVYIAGCNIISKLPQARKSIGYCPQTDDLMPMLTVRETLRMFGRIRGLSGAALCHQVEESIKAFLLVDHPNKQVKALSGGTRRKLILAAALIGEPPIVFLDEPTSGMDPVARKRMWSILRKYRDAGRTIVLTSHSMIECETLCTRLAIMINGQFKCIGSNQHLKQKFSRGYSVIVKVADAPEDTRATNIQSFISHVHESLPGCTLQDEQAGTVHFRVTTEVTPLPKIFHVLEESRTSGSIENYIVSQTTLEQVFLFLARSQMPPTPHTGVAVNCLAKMKTTCKRCLPF